MSYNCTYNYNSAYYKNDVVTNALELQWLNSYIIDKCDYVIVICLYICRFTWLNETLSFIDYSLSGTMFPNPSQTDHITTKDLSYIIG